MVVDIAADRVAFLFQSQLNKLSLDKVFRVGIDANVVTGFLDRPNALHRFFGNQDRSLVEPASHLFQLVVAIRRQVESNPQRQLGNAPAAKRFCGGRAHEVWQPKSVSRSLPNMQDVLAGTQQVGAKVGTRTIRLAFAESPQWRRDTFARSLRW